MGVRLRGRESLPMSCGKGIPVSYTHLDVYKRQVKDRAAAGEIDENRYTRYTMLLEELLERRKHQYD